MNLQETEKKTIKLRWTSPSTAKLQTKYETIKIKTAVLQNVIAAHYTKGQVARVLALSVNVRLSVSDGVRHCQNTVLA
jgi:hypothetical protein